MDVVAGVVAILGVLVQAVAWRRVARGRSVWRTMPPLFGVLGIASAILLPSIAAREAAAEHGFETAGELGLGLAAGAGLFLATRLFVAGAGRFPPFARHVRAAYRRASEVSVPAAIALSVCVVAPGEELFWRGLVYGIGVEQGLTVGFAGVTGWVLSVLANRPSRLLPIIAASIVGGALWTGLAWWTGGILAPVASHMLWTGLMLGFPPGPPRAEVV